MKTYYLTKDKVILIQSTDWDVIEKFAKERVEAMENDLDLDMSFTVYEKDEGSVYHVYHAWLSGGDGKCYFKSFSPRRDVTDSFNKSYV